MFQDASHIKVKVRVQTAKKRCSCRDTVADKAMPMGARLCTNIGPPKYFSCETPIRLSDVSLIYKMPYKLGLRLETGLGFRELKSLQIQGYKA